MQRKEYTGSCDHSLYFVAAYINRLQQFGVNVVSVTGLCLQVLKYTLAQYVRLSISIFNQRKKKTSISFLSIITKSFLIQIIITA